MGILNYFKSRYDENFWTPLLSLSKQISNKPDLKPILKKSLDYNAGLEYQLTNPDTLLENKNKDLTFYDTMMLDDRIKSIIELKKRLTLGIPYDFVAATEEEKDIEIKDFVQDVFDNLQIKFIDLLDNLLDAMVYGFKAGELIWKIDKGQIILDNIKFMHSVFYDFDYDEYGNLNKIYIGKDYGYDTVIEGEQIKKKFILFVYPYLKDCNYYGDSDLREVYTQYHAKYYIFRYRNVHLQNWGSPLPEVIYDKDITTKKEISDMEDMLKNLQDNLFILQPGKYNQDKGELIGKFKVNIHEAKSGTATKQYEEAIDQIDTQISRKLLVPDKLGFSKSDGGSYALGQTHFDLLMTVIEDLHRKIQECINPLIKQLVDYNFVTKEYPKLQFNKISHRMEAVAIKTLVDAGVIDQEEKWIRKYTGIPELDDKEKEELEKIKEKRVEEQQKIFDDANKDKEQNQKDKFNKQPDKMKVGKNPFDYKKIKKTFDDNEADFLMRYKPIYRENVEYINDQIKKKKIIENKDYKAIEKLRIKKTDLKQLFSEYYAKLYILGKQQAIEEIKDRITKDIQMQQVNMQSEEWLDKRWIDNYLKEYGAMGLLTKEDKQALITLRDKAFFITGITEDDLLKDVYFIIDNGIKKGEPGYTIISKITELGNERLERYGLTIARTNAASAYNHGRMNLFMSDDIRPLIEAYQYNAIIDDRTTLYCESHDGQIIKPSEAGLLAPPSHFNCRSELVPVLIEEKNQKGNWFYDYENKMGEWKANNTERGKGF